MITIQLKCELDRYLMGVVEDFSRRYKGEYGITAVSSGPYHVTFYDARARQRIAMVSVGYIGGAPIYEITGSRVTTKNGIHRRSEPASIIKLMEKYITPLTTKEIAERSSVVFVETQAQWAGDPEEAIHQELHGIKDIDIAEEIAHLAKSGVRFKNPLFKKAAAIVPDLYEEFVRVQNLDFQSVFILIQPNGRVDTYSNDGSCTATYGGVDELPKVMQEKMALLKLVDLKTFVPEVGVYNGENQYWVLVPKT